jgi:mannosyltransferase OCH1-like enzyme
MTSPDFFQSVSIPWGKSAKIFDFSHDSWVLLAKLYNESLVFLSAENYIPKIIHQIWVGGPMPDSEMQLANKIKNLNPDWEYRLWNEDNLEFIDYELLSKIKLIQNLGVKSDIIRYLVLYNYGGIYLDCDFVPIKRFDELIIGKKFIAGVCNPDNGNLPIINNGFIAAEKCNAILNSINIKVLSHIDQIIDIKNQNDVFKYTGPDLFTNEILNSLKTITHSGYVIYPSTFFYPINHRKKLFINDKLIEKSIYPETYVIHLWNASWFKTNKNLYSKLKLILPYRYFIFLSKIMNFLKTNLYKKK